MWTIKSLDGLRGLAVLLVLLSHMSLGGMHLLPVLDFSGIGKAGVYLFFTLSAFLLSRQALEEGALTSGRYWAGYLLRRFCRIYPLYLLVLIVALVITAATRGYGPAIHGPADIFRHLALQSGQGIYWAIPVEFKYYLLLPFVTLAFHGASKLHLLAVLALAALAVWLVQMLWPARETAANTIALGPYLQMFVLGSLAALLSTGRQARPRLLPGGLGWCSLLVALLTVPAFWRMLIDADVTNRAFHRDFLLYGLLWSTATLAALYGGLGFRACLETRPLRFLGRISFSVYLWHMVVIDLVARAPSLPPGVRFMLVLAIVLPFSYVSYRLIERPVIAWGHRVTENWRRA